MRRSYGKSRLEKLRIKKEWPRQSWKDDLDTENYEWLEI